MKNPGGDKNLIWDDSLNTVVGTIHSQTFFDYLLHTKHSLKREGHRGKESTVPAFRNLTEQETREQETLNQCNDQNTLGGFPNLLYKASEKTSTYNSFNPKTCKLTLSPQFPSSFQSKPPIYPVSSTSIIYHSWSSLSSITTLLV